VDSSRTALAGRRAAIQFFAPCFHLTPCMNVMKERRSSLHSFAASLNVQAAALRPANAVRLESTNKERRIVLMSMYHMQDGQFEGKFNVHLISARSGE
jgi:hypothetical protein